MLRNPAILTWCGLGGGAYSDGRTREDKPSFLFLLSVPVMLVECCERDAQVTSSPFPRSRKYNLASRGAAVHAAFVGSGKFLKEWRGRLREKVCELWGTSRRLGGGP